VSHREVWKSLRRITTASKTRSERSSRRSTSRATARAVTRKKARAADTARRRHVKTLGRNLDLTIYLKAIPLLLRHPSLFVMPLAPAR